MKGILKSHNVVLLLLVTMTSDYSAKRDDILPFACLISEDASRKN